LMKLEPNEPNIVQISLSVSTYLHLNLLVDPSMLQ